MSITRSIAKTISNYHDPNSIGSRFRKKRSEMLKSLIASAQRAMEGSSISILDVGGTRAYWNIFPIEFLRNNSIKVFLLNLEPLSVEVERDIFEEIIGDGRYLQFPNNSFNIVHSNSVIEHVGDFEDMKLFAREIARVGQKYFIQTPSFFSIEPHAMFPFFHWLPLKVKVKIVLNFQIGHWNRATDESNAQKIVKSAQLLKKSDLRKLFPEATQIYTERFFFPESYVVIKD